MKKLIAVGCMLIVSILLFVGCTTTDGSEKKNKKEDKNSSQSATKNDEKGKADEAIPVEVAKLETGTISSFQMYNSTIEAENSADVYSKISGIIIRIDVEEGDYVKKGQLLARIEDDEYTLAEKSARAAYEKAKKDYERAIKIYNNKHNDSPLSEKDFDQVKYTYERDKAAWEGAKLSLGYTKITAPIAGIISQRNIKNGNFISVNSKVFSIVDMNSLITKVYIPEKNVGKIKLGQMAKISSDALGEKEFNGKIKMISPVVDAETGTVKVTIDLKGYRKILRPGMFIKTHIITDTHERALLVTKKAIIYNGIQSVAFIVRDGVAHQVTLDVGYQNATHTEILNKDLKRGDKVITVGQFGLKDNARVKVINKSNKT